MGDRIDRADDGALDTPWTWLVVFHRDCRTRWVNRLVPGPFKHVSAIGFSPLNQTWIFYDPAIERTKIQIVRDGADATRILARWIAGATVVEMHLRFEERGPRWRVGLWCVPMIAQLLGIRSGAVLPLGLLRDCLRQGGKVIQDDGGRPGSAAGSCAAVAREAEHEQ